MLRKRSGTANLDTIRLGGFGPVSPLGSSLPVSRGHGTAAGDLPLAKVRGLHSLAKPSRGPGPPCIRLETSGRSRDAGLPDVEPRWNHIPMMEPIPTIPESGHAKNSVLRLGPALSRACRKVTLGQLAFAAKG